MLRFGVVTGSRLCAGFGGVDVCSGAPGLGVLLGKLSKVGIAPGVRRMITILVGVATAGLVGFTGRSSPPGFTVGAGVAVFNGPAVIVLMGCRAVGFEFKAAGGNSVVKSV